MRFRFVSSGQAVADAADFVQVLKGNSLKPLAPVNVRGYRDADGNLMVEWTRRARIAGGLRTLTDVPLAEEAATYVIEVYNGSTLVRTQTLVNTEVQDQPVRWRSAFNAVVPADRIPTQDEFGTLTFIHDADIEQASIQKLTGDFIFSFSLDPLGGTMPVVAILPYGNDSGGAVDSVQNSPGGGIILDSAGQALAADFSPDIRYYFVRKGSEIRIYQDDPNSTPVLTCSKQFLGGYEIFARESKTGDVVYRPRLTISDPGWFYTALQQTNDFGSTQSSVKVRIYQVSAVVGRGAFVEATI